MTTQEMLNLISSLDDVDDEIESLIEFECVREYDIDDLDNSNDEDEDENNY